MAVTSKPGSVTDKIAVDQLEVKPRAGGSVLADAAVKSGKPAAQMKRKKDEEDELQNLKDDVGATAEDVAGEWVDGQEGPMLLAQAETSGAAGSASGGGAAGTGAAAGSAAGAEAAGAAALSDAALGTIILGSFVGVAVIASTGGRCGRTCRCRIHPFRDHRCGCGNRWHRPDRGSVQGGWHTTGWRHGNDQ